MMHFDFDDKTRFLVIYQDVTKSPRSIAMYTGISLRTINFWISQLKLGVDITKVKQGRGRKRRLSDHDLEHIEEEVKENPYKASSRTLAMEYQVSPSCILSALHQLEFKYKSTKKVPQLTPEHKQRRVDFCDKMLKDPSQLQRIWFSDEMTCNLQITKPKVWTQEGTYFHETPKNQKLSVWAAISSVGKTSLEIYETSLTIPLYVQILDKHYSEMSRINWRSWAYQQDNLSIHVSPVVKGWLKSKAVYVIDWPPLSPDLNPIENIWAWLKGEVMKDNPRTIEDLKASLMKNWDRIDVSFLSNYINSLESRVVSIKENHGERINH